MTTPATMPVYDEATNSYKSNPWEVKPPTPAPAPAVK